MGSLPDVMALAAVQGGVVTRSQARDAGFSDRQISHRVTIGEWTPITAGVYRLFRRSTRRDRMLGALAALPDAVASHYSAAAIHGLGRLDTSTVSVMVHASTTHRFPGVRVFRTRDLAEHHVDVASGVRVTTAPRTIVDLAAVLRSAHIESVADDAVASGATTWPAIAQVVAEVARRGKAGSAVLRALTEDRLSEDLHGSRLEVLGIRLLTQAGIDGFVQEAEIPWSPGRRFDVAFDEQKLAIEWDSRRWHTQKEAFESDRERDREAALHGWQVIRFTWRDVTVRPGTVVEAVSSILARRTEGRESA